MKPSLSLCFVIGLLISAFGTLNIYAAQTLKLKNPPDAVIAAVQKVLSDPYFTRMTGLQILTNEMYPGDSKTQIIAGTQEFDFVINYAQETHQAMYGTNTEKVTTYDVTKQMYLAYFPRIWVPQKIDKDGICKVKIKCELASWAEKPVPQAFGDKLRAFAKDLALAALDDVNGFESIEYMNKARWSPFDPSGYPDWLEKNWLAWRLQFFLSGAAEDPIAQALTLCDGKKYSEAQPVLEGLAKQFPVFQMKSGTSADAATMTEMPDIHSMLGDIYLNVKHDTARARIEFEAAANPNSAPFLGATKGRALANRNFGIILGNKAKALRQTAPKTYEDTANAALLHLRAYLGNFDNGEAPDREQIMSLIKAIDPDRMRDEQRQEEKAKDAEKETRQRHQQQEKVKDLMEF